VLTLAGAYAFHAQERVLIVLLSTNTDGVIIDPMRSGEPDKGIVAW
jgi:hypothetical protein